MIKINSKEGEIAPDPFKFKTKYYTKTEKFLDGESTSQTRQDILINQLEYLIQDLKLVPCDFDVIVGSDEGKKIQEGDIDVYSKSAKIRSEIILELIQDGIKGFSCNFPLSSFTIKCKQQMIITV